MHADRPAGADTPKAVGATGPRPAASESPAYDPSAIALVRGAEIAAVVLLGASLVARFVTAPPKARW